MLLQLAKNNIVGQVQTPYVIKTSKCNRALVYNRSKRLKMKYRGVILDIPVNCHFFNLMTDYLYVSL